MSSSSGEEEEELRLTMYQEVQQCDDIVPETSVSGLRRSQQYAISKSIDLDKEEELQEKSSRIKCIVLVVVTLVVVAVLVGVIVAVMKEGRKRGNGTADEFNENGYLGNGRAVVNDSQYFCGPLLGEMEGDVIVFKGIPYASPPVGNLRWLRPEPLHNEIGYCWIQNVTAGFDAGNYGNKCFQRHDNATIDYHGDEDCLYVNVWTPELGSERLRCVLVYIHGGDFLSGSGHDDDTVPTSEVVRNTDCVFVSFNYRLNVFGFLSVRTGDNDRIHGNLGLHDQIFALQWVQKHVQAFGGDPDRVTLYGDGAGASSILALVSSSLASGLFHRAWLISPAPKIDGTLEQADHQNSGILSAAGCTRGTHQNKLHCLRNIPAERLLKMSAFDLVRDETKRSFPSKGDFGLVMAVADDFVIPRQSVIESWEDGPANDVPMIIGSSAQEVDDYPQFPIYNKTSWAEYESYVKSMFEPFGRSISARVLNFYPPDNKTSPEFLISSMISDIRAVCPTNSMSTAAATYFKSSIYRYINKHQSPMPPQDLEMDGKQYSFHKMDLYAFLGNLDLYSDSMLRSDISQSHLFQLRMGEFAQEGEVEYAWMPYPNATAEFMSGRPNILDKKLYKQEVCDYWRIMGFFPAYAWTV